MVRNRSASDIFAFAGGLFPVRARSFPAILLALLLLVPGAGQAASGDDPTAQLMKLQTVVFDYADKYMSAIAQVTNEIQEQEPTNADLRLSMHGLKLLITASVQQLAVTPNPEATLLDMMVFATLHRITFSEKWARERYGDHSKAIVKTMAQLEKEIWALSSDYLSKEQKVEVRRLIREWKAKHPDLTVVSLIRFGDFASLRSQSPLVSKARRGGFLVDTSGAEKSVDEALLLAERVLHYSQRLPWIIEWQVEQVFYRLAVMPEVKQTLGQTQEMSRSLERFADAVDKLPRQVTAERRASIEQMASAIATERSAAIGELGEVLAAERRATVEDIRQSISTERVALFAELDVREKMLKSTVNTVREGLADADKLAVNVRQTAGGINEALVNADKLMARFESDIYSSDDDSVPFNINEYVLAIKELTIAIQEANTLLLSTERITGGADALGGVFNRVLWTGTILILILCVAVFITMLIYRAAARHIVARSSFEFVPPSSDRSA